MSESVPDTVAPISTELCAMRLVGLARQYRLSDGTGRMLIFVVLSENDGPLLGLQWMAFLLIVRPLDRIHRYLPFRLVSSQESNHQPPV